jgi:hypothetical protein
MTKPPSLRPSHTEPRQVWEQLDAKQQHRALQLLAQMALHFLTAQGAASHTEDFLCSHSTDPQSYALTISPAPR